MGKQNGKPDPIKTLTELYKKRKQEQLQSGQQEYVGADVLDVPEDEFPDVLDVPDPKTMGKEETIEDLLAVDQPVQEEPPTGLPSYIINEYEVSKEKVTDILKTPGAQEALKSGELDIQVQNDPETQADLRSVFETGIPVLEDPGDRPITSDTPGRIPSPEDQAELTTEQLQQNIVKATDSAARHEEFMKKHKESVERNFFWSFLKAGKETVTLHLPAGAEALGAMRLQGMAEANTRRLLEISRKDDSDKVRIRGAGKKSREYTVAEAKEILAERVMQNNKAAFNAINFAMEKNAEMSKSDLVRSWSQVKDGVDIANFIASSAGNMIAQLPMMIASGGATSFVMEAGLTYIEGINKIIEEHKQRGEDITAEQVIDQGLDDKAAALAWGGLAASLDLIGAGKVIKAMGFGKKALRDGLASRVRVSAIWEGGTEGVQSVLTQIGAGRVAGEDMATAMNRVSGSQIADEFTAGLFGGPSAVIAHAGARAILTGEGRADIKSKLQGIKETAGKVKEKVKQRFTKPPADEEEPPPPETGATVEEEEVVEEQVEEEEVTEEPVKEPGISKDNEVVASIYEDLTKVALSNVEDSAEAEILMSEHDAKDQITDEWIEKADQILKNNKDAISKRKTEEVPVGEQAKGSEATEQARTEEEESEEDVREPDEAPIKVTSTPTYKIDEDLKRFQTRRKPFSEKSVQSIVDAVKEGIFNIKKFDPVRIWKDPDDGKTYVLAGHSRIEAFRRLEDEQLSDEATENLRKQGIEGFTNVPSIVMDELSEEEAIQFAKRESNVMATKESDLDVATEWRNLREEGKSDTEIRELMKGRDNLTRKELLSYLKPDGKVMEAIELMEGTNDFEAVAKIGEYIGAARKRHSNLTDVHEDELLDWVNKHKDHLPTRADFLARLDNIVSDMEFNPEEPLNLDRKATRGENEARIRTELDELKARRKKIPGEMDKATTQEKIDELRRELANLDKEIVRLNAEIEKARKSDKDQTDIFTAPPEEKKEKEVLPIEEFVPKDDWKNNIIKAREYSKALNIPFVGLDLEEIVANIEEFEAKRPKPKSEELGEETQKKVDELKNLLGKFGKGDKATTGIDPEQIALAGEIIAKAAEIGVTKFQQLVAWIEENVPGWLEDNYNALRAAYVSAAIAEGVEEDFNKIAKQEVKDAINEGKNQRASERGTPEPVQELEEEAGTGPVPGEERRPVRKPTREPDEVGPDTVRGEGGGVGGPGDLHSTTGDGNAETNRELGGKSRDLTDSKPGDGVVEPKRESGNFVIPKDFINEATFKPAKRFDSNITVIELLQTLKEEQRPATTEEQDILFQYSGWGGLKEIAIDPHAAYKWNDTNVRFRDRVEKTMNLLKDIYGEGFNDIERNIKGSILNAHYTPPSVIRGIYEGLKSIGIKGKSKILEPSAGIGHFMGSMPSDIRKGSSVHAVELDQVTADILGYLYPSTDISKMGLEATNLPNNYYDLVVGNIPFGNYNVADPEFMRGARGRSKKAIHNYFFAKGLDLVRPGGLVAFITTTGILDSPSNQFIRDHIAEEAEFLGALKLPTSTFKGIAGTEVTTDLIFLKKSEKGAPTQEHSFTKPIATGLSYNLNDFFRKNPQYMLGKLTPGGIYGDEGYRLLPEGDIDLEAVIAQKIKELVPDPVYEPFSPQVTTTEFREAYDVEDNYTRQGNIVVHKGQVGTIERPGQFRKISLRVSPKTLIDYMAMRSKLNELINAEVTNEDDTILEPIRKDLNTRYDNFVESNRRLNDPKNILWIAQDIDSFNLFALERYDKDTKKFIGKADIFTKRTISPITRPKSAANPKDALTISLGEFGRVNTERIADLLQIDETAAIEELGGLIYELPEGGYASSDEYMSGNVKEKLIQAKKAAELDPRFKKNVEALESVIPDDVPASLIGMSMGASWIPLEAYESFLDDVYNLSPYNVTLTYMESSDEVKFVTRHITAEMEELTTQRMNAGEVIKNALIQKYVKFTNTITLPDGTTTREPDLAGTQAAREAVDSVRDKFEEWAQTNEVWSEKLQRVFNDRFNTTIKRKWDGQHLTLPGYAGPTLRPHQKDGAWMVVQNQGGVLDHSVGSGKTLVMVVAAMELKRLGLAKKSMILAKKANAMDVTLTARTTYPHAKILGIDKASFSKNDVRSTLAQIANNDWDIIVITHDNFNRVPADIETEKALITEEITKIDIDLDNLNQDKGPNKRQIRAAEEKKKTLSARLQEINKKGKDPTLRYFNELGVDHLFVDESQEFKNLRYTTKHGTVKGLGNTKGSNRSTQLLYAIRYLQKLHKGDKGVTFASGTTVTNSIVELYSILNYLRPNKLQELGLTTFDSWAGTFADQAAEVELTVVGNVSKQVRFRRFKNVPELSMLYSEIADVRNDSNLKLPKPELNKQLVLVKPTTANLRFAKRLINFAKTGNYSVLGLGEGTPGQEKAKMLVATTAAQKASVDMGMLFEEAPDHPDSKISVVANAIAKRYHQSNAQKGVQLVFTIYRNGVAEFDVHEKLKKKLVEDYEIPAEEIKWIQDSKSAIQGTLYSEPQRKNLYDDTNDGKVRVLIGNIQTMGVGINVQKRVVAMYHMQLDWKPAPHDQADGRGSRQGNDIAEQFYDNKVDSYYYGMERSLDAYKFKLLETKAMFINQLKNGAVGERVVEEKGDDTVKDGEFIAALTGNPAFLKEAEVDHEIKKMTSDRRTFDQKKYNDKKRLEEMKGQLEAIQKHIPRLQQDADALESQVKKDKKGEWVYEVTLEGTVYTKPKDAGELLYDRITKALPDMRVGTELKIGDIYGFPIVVQAHETTVIGGQNLKQAKWLVVGPSNLMWSWGGSDVIDKTKESAVVTLGRFPMEALQRITKALKGHQEQEADLKPRVEKLGESAAKQWDRSQELTDLRKEHAKLKEDLEKYDLDEELGEAEGPLFDDEPLGFAAPRQRAKKSTKKGRREPLGKPLGEYEKREGEPVEPVENFKLHQGIIDIIRKWAPRSKIGEGFLKRMSIGTFFPKGKHTRILGINDFDVALHEITHAVDDNYSVIRNFIGSTTQGHHLRSRMTDIYEEFYPGADRGHRLQVRMTEGLAVLVQKMAQSPSLIGGKYKSLVDAFLKKDGEFAFEGVEEYMNDIEELIKRYQALNPLAVIGARVYDTEIDPKTGKPFMSGFDKFQQEMFDAIHVFEKLAKENGSWMTADDIAQTIRHSNYATNIANQNINGELPEYWGFSDESENGLELVRKFDYNYKTLERQAKKLGEKDWSYYLYATKLRFEYKRLNDYYAEKAQIETDITTLEAVLENEEASKLEKAKAQESISIKKIRLRFVEQQIDRYEIMLENEQVTELEAESAYKAGKPIFSEISDKLYDLEYDMLKLLHHPLVQLVDEEHFDEFSKNKEYYVPFKRTKYDEWLHDEHTPNTPVVKGIGKTKVSSLMRRVGSTKGVLNPFIGAQINHTDIMQKAMRQRVYNMFIDMENDFPEFFRHVPYHPGIENNPDVIIARKNYKKYPIAMPKGFKTILDENYAYEMHNIVTAGLITWSKIFRASTTGAWLAFPIVNIPLDQVTGFINTRNNYIPFYHIFKIAVPAGARYMLQRGAALIERFTGMAITIKDSPESYLFKEYLHTSGLMQTFLHAHEKAKTVSKKDATVSRLRRNVKAIPNLVFDIFSLPGLFSEIATRMSEYILARKAGKPQVVTIEEAGRVSTPFHHMGRQKWSSLSTTARASAKPLVRTLSYMNASLEVLHQAGRSATESKEGLFKTIGVMVALTAGAIAATMRLLNDDDREEALAILKGKSPELLTKYLYMPSPFSNKELLKVRIPEQYGMFAGMANMMLMEMMGEGTYSPMEYMDALTSMLPTQFNPFEGWQMLWSWIPPGPKAVGEVAANIKTFPSVRPIDYPYEIAKKLPSERVGKFTSPGAIKIADTFHEMGIELSPKKIDHLITGSLGRSSKYIMGTPGAFDFTRSLIEELYLEGTRQVQWYRDAKTEVDQLWQSAKDTPDKYSDKQVDRIKALLSVLYGEAQRTDLRKGRPVITRSKNGLDDLWATYRAIDVDVEPVRASELRMEILRKIKELEHIYHGNKNGNKNIK